MSSKKCFTFRETSFWQKISLNKRVKLSVNVRFIGFCPSAVIPKNVMRI